MEGGTSSTLLESMACKTPIIATLVGGNKDILIHMQTAYIVKPNNPSEIIDAVEYLFSNPEKGKLLSNNAFEVVKNYDWEHIIQKFIDIYQKVLA
jgi:glycosyltransferase involved in cell wall biosynthesis